MSIGDIPTQLKRFEIPGRITILEGNGDLPKIEVTTDWSSAEIYLLGAHVTDFQKKGEPPLLFLSQCSRFAVGQSIRGGIPVIFPWFGQREGLPMHGFARTNLWNLHEATALPEGGVTLRFSLPEVAAAATGPPFSANYVVTVTDRLHLELIITNAEAGQNFTFENCLHTYFEVGNVHEVAIQGLKGATYLDKMENFAAKTETSEVIKITGETDRVYLDNPGPVEIHDPKLRRKIRLTKTGAASTVVWNPGPAKAQQMPDFGDNEYARMLCVESGNVNLNKITLAPGRSVAMKLELSTEGI